MKVFIPFSGNLSEQLALAFREWLPDVIKSVETFVSSKDIWMGSRWHDEIAKQLAETNCGILCLTSTNFDAPWLNFEGGALSKLDRSAVFPFLFDLPVSALEGRPLAQFQAVRNNREDILAMGKSINRLQESNVQLTHGELERNFSLCWPRLKAKLDDIRKKSHATGVSAEPAKTAELQIVEAIKPRLSEHSGQRASECAGSSASPEPTVRPRRRGVSSLRPPISKRWDETVRPRIRGVSSLRSANRGRAV
jgi:hypothetical protein